MSTVTSNTFFFQKKTHLLHSLHDSLRFCFSSCLAFAGVAPERGVVDDVASEGASTCMPSKREDGCCANGGVTLGDRSFAEISLRGRFVGRAFCGP